MIWHVSDKLIGNRQTSLGLLLNIATSHGRITFLYLIYYLLVLCNNVGLSFLSQTYIFLGGGLPSVLSPLIFFFLFWPVAFLFLFCIFWKAISENFFQLCLFQGCKTLFIVLTIHSKVRTVYLAAMGGELMKLDILLACLFHKKSFHIFWTTKTTKQVESTKALWVY